MNETTADEMPEKKSKTKTRARVEVENKDGVKAYPWPEDIDAWLAKGWKRT